MGSGTTTARSRFPGMPTTLGPPADGPRGQLGLGFDGDLDGDGGPPAGVPVTLRPGIVHVPGWLDLDAQQALVADVRRWAVAQAT